ncbi:MAG: Rpn family recombination-promoting nuclease/putative transposase [Oscillospiraceae bacterium]
MAEMKYTAKDSVFSFIFKQPENTRRLYLTLHPEDTGVTEADCKLVTLEHVLTNGVTNDLGFQVRDKLILLVEAQSKFSVNIALRMLLYLAATYKEYVDDHKLDLYGGKPVPIPRPELYMIYAGAPRQLPEILRLSDMYDGPGSAEIEIKVLRDMGEGNIVDQYIRFCEISDTQRKQYGYTKKAVEETLRICGEENILMPFLASRQKEVRDIMVTLFDQERVAEIHEYNVAKDARLEGQQEGIEKGIRAMVLTLKEFTTDKVAIAQKLMKQFELLPQAAEEKVELYWNS